MDTDLLIVGGGPAGCAAAVMAASVGMRSILVEAEPVLCHKLRCIPALGNVLGSADGPALAAAITADLRSTALCRVEPGRRVTEVRGFDDHVQLTVDGDRRLRAPRAVVATGVGPLRPGDVTWITSPPDLALPPLWEADAADVAGRTVLVIGADRPLGTLLRAEPDMSADLLAVHPPEDGYKADEVRDDPRVTLIPVQRLTLGPLGPSGAPESASGSASVTAETVGPDGERRIWKADTAFLNIGSAAAAPPGDLVRDSDGYCPPARQHPRIIVAGDLRSARYQRIMTAMGSGGEAALRAYHAEQRLPDQGP